MRSGRVGLILILQVGALGLAGCFSPVAEPSSDYSTTGSSSSGASSSGSSGSTGSVGSTGGTSGSTGSSSGSSSTGSTTSGGTSGTTGRFSVNSTTGFWGPAQRCASDTGTAFEAPVTFPVLAKGPTALALADVDGDRRPDVLIAFRGGADGGGLAVLSNLGDGLALPETIPGGLNAVGMTTLDVDGDGRLDVLLTGATGPGLSDVQVLQNRGAGAWTAGWSVAPGPGLAFVAAGDFDGDHRPDVAVGLENMPGVQVALNSATGLGPASAYPTYGDVASALAIADLDGDGSQDLVTIGPSAVVALYNDGTGRFPNALPLVGVSANDAILGAWPSDVDRDGRTDLVVLTNQALHAVLNRGGRSYGSVLTALPTVASDAVVADFNGDSFPDVAVLDGSGLSIWLGAGNGSFVEHASYALCGMPGQPRALDLNRDGRADLLVGLKDKAEVAVLFGAGSGDFAPEVDFAGTYPGPYQLADLDGDGKLDLVFLSPGDDELAVLLGK